LETSSVMHLNYHIPGLSGAQPNYGTSPVLITFNCTGNFVESSVKKFPIRMMCGQLAYNSIWGISCWTV